MNKEKEKIREITDLVAWQLAHRLAVRVYELTKAFPREEVYALVDQMRRCAVSVAANIAEGFGRRSQKEKFQFYSVASGSLSELLSHLFIAKDVGYLTDDHFRKMRESIAQASKVLNGLLASTKR